MRSILLAVFLFVSSIASAQSGGILMRDTVCYQTTTVIGYPQGIDALWVTWLPVSYLNSQFSLNPSYYSNYTGEDTATFTYLINRLRNDSSVVTDTFVMKVLPPLAFSPVTIADINCAGFAQTITFASNFAIDSFEVSPDLYWTSTGGNSIIFNPPDTISYEIWAYNDRGCRTTSQNLDFYINEGPGSLNFDISDTIICVNRPPFPVTNFTPPGGIFSIDGVPQDTALVVPLNLGVGNHLLAYSLQTEFCSFIYYKSISIVTLPPVNFTDMPNFCREDPPFQLTATPGGGIFFGAGVIGSVFTPGSLTSGNYNVSYVFDAGFGCIDTATQQVTIIPVPAGPDIYTTDNREFFCDGDSITVYAPNLSNYLWNNGATSSSITFSSSATVWLTTLTSLGCNVYSDTISVTGLAPVVTGLEGVVKPNGFNTTYATSADGEITSSVTGGMPPYAYLWSTFSTDVNLNGLPAGTYVLDISDSEGCTWRDSITLISPDSIPPSVIVPDTELLFPNSFTPNADGYNDQYSIIGLLPAYLENRFQVFNRLGRLVYSANNYSNNWEGVDLKGNKLIPGSYFCIFSSPALATEQVFFVELMYADE